MKINIGINLLPSAIQDKTTVYRHFSWPYPYWLEFHPCCNAIKWLLCSKALPNDISLEAGDRISLWYRCLLLLPPSDVRTIYTKSSSSFSKTTQFICQANSHELKLVTVTGSRRVVWRCHCCWIQCRCLAGHWTVEVRSYEKKLAYISEVGDLTKLRNASPMESKAVLTTPKLRIGIQLGNLIFPISNCQINPQASSWDRQQCEYLRYDIFDLQKCFSQFSKLPFF